MVKKFPIASSSEIKDAVEDLYRDQSRFVFATLIRLIGDFDLAEEALQEAFAVAVVNWRRDGMPANPRAWLVSTARFKAIDTIRRRARISEGKRIITDGPFAETTEQLGGYYLIDVKNLDEAIAIAGKLPPVKKGTVEIRPIFELENLPTASNGLTRATT